MKNRSILVPSLPLSDTAQAMHARILLRKDEICTVPQLVEVSSLTRQRALAVCIPSCTNLEASRRFAGIQHMTVIDCRISLLAPVTYHGYAFGVQESQVIPNVAQMHATPPGRAPFQAATGRDLSSSLCRCRPIKGSFPLAVLGRRLSPAPLKPSLPLYMVSLMGNGRSCIVWVLLRNTLGSTQTTDVCRGNEQDM